MSEHICAKCNQPVAVPDGYEFDDGDLCWSCLANFHRTWQPVAEAAKACRVLAGEEFNGQMATLDMANMALDDAIEQALTESERA